MDAGMSIYSIMAIHVLVIHVCSTIKGSVFSVAILYLLHVGTLFHYYIKSLFLPSDKYHSIHNCWSPQLSDKH